MAAWFALSAFLKSADAGGVRISGLGSLRLAWVVLDAVLSGRALDWPGPVMKGLICHFTQLKF